MEAVVVLMEVEYLIRPDQIDLFWIIQLPLNEASCVILEL